MPSTLAGGETAAADTSVDNDEVEVDYVAVRDELLAMRDADQSERAEFGDRDTGQWGDEDRTTRLIGIIDSFGWPTPEMVGEEASTARGSSCSTPTPIRHSSTRVENC